MAPKITVTPPIKTPVKTMDAALYDKLGTVRNSYTPVKLDNRQRQSWDMTRSALLWNCPAFTHVLYTMMARQDDTLALFTRDIECAATDGSVMLLNPDWFFKLTLPQRVFVCAHEISHAIFDHCGQAHIFKQRGYVITSSGKKLEYDGKTLNVAQDLIINDMLIESKIGEFVKQGCHDTNLGTHADSAVDVYEKIFKKKPPGGGQGQGPGGPG